MLRNGLIAKKTRICMWDDFQNKDNSERHDKDTVKYILLSPLKHKQPKLQKRMPLFSHKGS